MKPLVGFYGDDFTGSTDAMEILARAGLRTVLFVGEPTPQRLARFPDLQAVGIAGNTRGLPTEEMAGVVRPALERLRSFGPRLIHYKICSTFDSSPRIGSIGRVIETGAALFGPRPVPVVAGAPELGRYCVFGNLFARSGIDGEPFRLDRHPTMSRHPMTPMDESDLRIQLGRQTAKRIDLLDVLSVAAGPAEALKRYRSLAAGGAEAILIDLLLEEQLSTIGLVLWEMADENGASFVVGSSGVEMALTAWWRESGMIGEPSFPLDPGRSEPILAASGSCSPVTARQIEAAAALGFALVPLEGSELAADRSREAAIDAAVRRARDHLRSGRSVLVHTARGPEDPAIDAAMGAFASAGGSQDPRLAAAEACGLSLGKVVRRILEQVEVRRAVVAGGDTAGRVARELGIEALEWIAPMAPGSPLCRAHATGSPAGGMEICFKGGQVGTKDFFAQVLKGRSSGSGQDENSSDT